MTTALVMIVMLGLLAVAFLGVFLLSRGVDERSKAQSAADAAALAGAGVLDDAIPELLGLVHGKTDLASLIGCGLGEADARHYADANDAAVTSYCFDAGSDRISVEVRMQDPVSGDVGPAEAGAVAETGLRLGSCWWHDATPDPVEPPADDDKGGGKGDGKDDEPPPPPPDIPTTLDCGPLHASFLIGGVDGLLRLTDFHLDRLEPRLVD